MSRAALHITRTQINRWFLVQTLAIIIATIGCLWLQGSFFARSIFIGGLLCMLPQWLFARLWLAYYKASAAPKIVKMFYIGEVLKLLLTVSLFLLTFHFISINPIACLSGFMIAQVAFWMAPLLIGVKKVSTTS